MSIASIINRMSPDDYLDLERDAEQRHDYLDGEVVAMAVGSRAHNLLATRVARLLGNHLEGSPCRVYQSDMKVRVERANRFYYPDVMVCCDPLGRTPTITTKPRPSCSLRYCHLRRQRTTTARSGSTTRRWMPSTNICCWPPRPSDAVLYRRNGAFWTRYALTEGDDLELESIGFRQDLAGVPRVVVEASKRIHLLCVHSTASC